MFEETRKRYPGAQPFPDSSLARRLFYGREQEANALTHQILANRLVVLYARSGLGKTSLLNAGVAESLRAEGFLPLVVRVDNTKLGALESVYRGIASACAQQDIEYQAGEQGNLWYFFKTAQFWRDDLLLKPILILDQFEELFTLQSEQNRNAFLDQLSYLVRGVRPLVEEEDTSQLAVSDTPPPVKIVLSIREDFLAYLEEISDRIPEILAERFRLLPLTRQAASHAIEAPTTIEDSALFTKPFKLDTRARDAVLDFLEQGATSAIRKSSNYIEPFQLQLICQRIEELAEHKQKMSVRDVIVTVEEIGKESILRKILRSFYTRQVATIPSFMQRHGVKKLCSEYLISPLGRRLRMEESEIKRIVGVNAETLRTLVDRRLLRVDQSVDGSYYELSHDSLIRPVMTSRRFLFFIRASLYLIFLLVTLLLILFLGYALIRGIIETICGRNKDEVEVILSVLLLIFGLLFFFLRRARQNLREIRTLFSRSRI